MDPVPVYISLYLLKVGRHSGEVGYLKRRLEDADLDRAVYEKSMVKEALALNLIAATDDEDVLTLVDEKGIAHAVSVPRSFILLARAHYLPLEAFAGCAKWLLAAVVGGLISLVLNG